jgi:hypothetical protein
MSTPQWFAEFEREEAKRMERIENLRAERCTCMDVYGENPKCPKHGEGTAWALENPEL